MLHGVTWYQYKGKALNYHLQWGSCHKHRISLSQPVMHKLHSCTVHCVAKKRHSRLKDATAGLARGNPELQHLFILQHHVSVWCHLACTGLPARVQCRKIVLHLLPWAQLATAHTHHPDTYTHTKCTLCIKNKIKPTDQLLKTVYPEN